MQQNPQNPMGAPGGVPGPVVPGGGMPRMDQPNMGMGGPQQGPSQGPQVRDILPFFSIDYIQQTHRTPWEPKGVFQEKACPEWISQTWA